MSMKYVRDTYGVPAKRGRRFIYVWPDGDRQEFTITSAKGGYIRSGPRTFHPTYGIVYLNDDGSVLMDPCGLMPAAGENPDGNF